MKKPKLRGYWSTSNFISTQFSGSVMSRNWFTAILLILHVSDSATYLPRNEPGHDPVHKIRPFLEHLLTHFPASFSPYENLTIDEDVCGFHGRVIFHVYIKNKPDKYGIKMFTVCESKTGNVLRTEVCTGKGQQDKLTLDYFRDYCLVILIRGIQFSWTDFTVQWLFLISCGQEKPKL